MFSLDELSRQIAAYCDRCSDLPNFEDWFRSSSWGSYARHGDRVSDVIASVEAALSSHEFGEIDENQLRWDLANVVAPFAEPASVSVRTISLVYGKPLLKATTVSGSALRRKLAIA